MYKVSIPAGHLKKFTSLLSNKLTSTYNIIPSGIIVKSNDLEVVLKLADKNSLKITYKKVAS